jgi:signal transduction histidine kinase
MMISSRTPRPASRLPTRTLRAQLALLYAALFCVSAVALGAAAVIFKPNFLVGTSCKAAPHQPSHPVPSCGNAQQSFFGTVAHDASQNPAGVAMIAVMVVLAVGAGWLLAGRVVRPLRAITSSARAISASNLNQRLGLGGSVDEFAELGETLDDLFGRLEASFESQRHFVANASHELRTPLAAERTLLQVALADPDADAETLRSTCEQLLTLGEQQERLIEGLLTLASSERGVGQWESVDLAEVARKVILVRRPEAERRGIHVDATLSAAPASGDPSLVESLVANLIENALRHNEAAGQVEISTTMTDGRAIISVSNTGTVIPPHAVERLSQPFQQLGSERIGHADGHGLGLAIVYAIARAHDATLAARVRPEGGLDVVVSFL